VYYTWGRYNAALLFTQNDHVERLLLPDQYLGCIYRVNRVAVEMLISDPEDWLYELKARSGREEGYGEIG